MAGYEASPHAESRLHVSIGSSASGLTPGLKNAEYMPMPTILTSHIPVWS